MTLFYLVPLFLPTLPGFQARASEDSGSTSVVEILKSPISVASYADFKAWGEKVANLPWDHYQCRPLAEFKQIAVCLFSHSLKMNNLFLHASQIVEGARYSSSDTPNLGFDLRLDDLETMVVRKPFEDGSWSAGRMTKNDADFLSWLIGALRHNLGAEALVASAWGNLATLEHELLHAQYFADKKYQDVVADFFENTLTGDERQLLAHQFSRYYNTENLDLMRNEFQAYMLQSSDDGLLQTLRRKYRSALIARLKQSQALPWAFNYIVESGAVVASDFPGRYNP